MSIINKIFGDPNEKALKKIYPIIEEINKLESKFQEMPDEQLQNQTVIFRERIEKGETLDQILPEAFAVVREASKRIIKQRHYDVQLIGGIVLHQGNIAEMKTGEGKTLVSTLAIYLNAIGKKGAHLVTVNDYLSKRDATWMGPIYHFLGLSVGILQHDKSFLFDPKAEPDDNEVTVEMENLREITRKQAYGCDITYGTNNEFGFDYLRDNMKFDLQSMVQRGHNYAIVDEVDSILIDEARTPLIISGPLDDRSELYITIDKFIPLLGDDDFELDEKQRSVTFNEDS